MGLYQNVNDDRPYVILNAAMTLDGKIATKTGDSKMSSKEDLVRVHGLRASVDAIMVGINTVLVDDPSLTVRYCEGKNPMRVVVDSRARTPVESRIISSKSPTLIATTSKAPEDRVKNLERAGAKVIVCGGGEKVDLKILLKKLKEMGVRKVVVEGGGNINWSFVSQNLFDELHVTICPFIIGGRDSVTLVEGDGVARIDEGVRVKLYEVKRFGDEVVLTYRPLR
ncbi:MAG: 2,5-diamino-6-(ribosylamino)-4(3H)-pyrimidinone 5'-phosphate reductase [archaeon]|nr:2,5-diamino-6-(ribosylamino)-4(3H)-pyrimidinone 5'-phosphate reductase [archaeon]MCP8306245.1 2,5-diamino-6-(ribosylamino)-4(3H)-pyrimidinone 5'-phosphate reductase [archaeon]